MADQINVKAGIMKLLMKTRENPYGGEKRRSKHPGSNDRLMHLGRWFHRQLQTKGPHP